MDSAVFGDVVDGVDDDSRRRAGPAEASRPEPISVNAHKAASSVVVHQRRDDQPRQSGQRRDDQPRQSGQRRDDQPR